MIGSRRHERMALFALVAFTVALAMGAWTAGRLHGRRLCCEARGGKYLEGMCVISSLATMSLEPGEESINEIEATEPPP
jgi:hypothetical protein